jgi:hypothetical protein
VIGDETIVEFFSNDCHGCGHPLLGIEVTNETNQWMNRAVAITPKGSIFKGDYDGHGGLVFYGAFWDGIVDGINTVWHEACWQAAGTPPGYQGAATISHDQGRFFAEGAHDMPRPSRGDG